LVTGAAGFIGQRTLPLLLSSGCEVHAVSRAPRVASIHSLHWHACDLFDERAVAELVESVQATHLLHLAWCTEYPGYWTSLDNLKWVRSTLVLAERFQEAGGVRAAFAGTCAEYDWSYGFCSETLTPLAPQTLYGTAKDATRRMLTSYASLTQLSTAWARLFFMFGHDEHPNKLVRSISQALLDGREAPCSEGSQIRDFLHVEDVAAALVAILASPVHGAINVGSGQATTVRQLVQELADLTGNASLLRPGAVATRAGEAPCVLADVRRLREEVGFQPAVDRQARLEQVVEQLRR
jgi:nucleoside-diphosphate-sugar epimerase